MEMACVLPAPPERHSVQLHGSDAALVRRVTDFLEAAPGTGRIVIATAEHRAELAKRLDPARLTLLDAQETLGLLMVDGSPDERRFQEHVGALVRQAAAQGPVRLFGEMVALLAQAGDFAGAARLEGMWNRLLADVDATLLCAYPASLFATTEGKAALAEVCSLHAAADLLDAPPGDPLLTTVVEVLQERSNALSLEVARRTQAEEELADFVENALEGLHRVGPDGRILWANQAELDLLGYARHEYVGRPIAEFHADPHVIADMLDRLRRGQAIRDQDARLRCKDGSIRHVRVTSNSRMQDGRLVYTRCFTRDVTDKQHLERQLEARNRQHAAVARLGQLALSERDLRKVLDTAVREAAEALDVQFCKILQLRPGGDLLLRAGTGWRPGLVGTLTIAAGLESQAGYTLQSGGAVIATDLSTETRFHPTPLLTEHGVVSGMGVAIDGPERPYGVLSVHTAHRREFNEDDIHFLQSIAHLLAAALERNNVEAQLRQHRESLEASVAERTGDLQEALRELEAFSYTVSHDLRTPLRAIDGYSRLLLLRNADSLSPQARQMLEAIGDQAIRMGRLIESVLALSRIGRADLDRQALDLSGMATEILQQFAQASPGRGVTWDVEPGLVAQGDPELVRLALENLLGNAWKFTSHAAAPHIRLRKAGDAFCVEDNGAGFDMAHAGQLFQPFHRLHAASQFDGTGIGLATVARIVRRHGGRIWAESAPDEGARFYFELPGVLQLAAAQEATAQALAAPNA